MTREQIEFTECECGDPGCPVHLGKEQCDHTGYCVVLYRIDMEDEEGTPMCQGCADDALDSGVFTSDVEDDEDEEPAHMPGCICADCSGAELTARND